MLMDDRQMGVSCVSINTRTVMFFHHGSIAVQYSRLKTCQTSALWCAINCPQVSPVLQNSACPGHLGNGSVSLWQNSTHSHASSGIADMQRCCIRATASCTMHANDTLLSHLMFSKPVANSTCKPANSSQVST